MPSCLPQTACSFFHPPRLSVRPSHRCLNVIDPVIKRMAIRYVVR